MKPLNLFALLIILVSFEDLPAQAFQTVQKGSAYSIRQKSSSRSFDTYILGPGDSLNIELYNIPELSGVFTIGPDGIIYLPRVRALYVEGLTVEELRYFLLDQFKVFVKEPQIYISPVSYRPVRIYVGGEVSRPGYYTLSGNQVSPEQVALDEYSDPITVRRRLYNNTGPKSLTASQSELSSSKSLKSGFNSQLNRWPTLYDAIRAAQGVTPFSDLSAVNVVRKQPLSSGGGKIRASIDFINLITAGDESVNIRLMDGDVVSITRSTKVLRDQLLAASRTNLSPSYIEVFVSGRVKEPGPQSLPQGATLNQAIASAGGAKLIRGQVEFIRFGTDGTSDRRKMSLNLNAKAGDYANPVLRSGDIVRVNESLFSATVGVLNELAVPLVGVYSVYSLFKP